MPFVHLGCTFFVVQHRLQTLKSLLPEFHDSFNVVRFRMAIVVHALLNVTRLINWRHHKVAHQVVVVRQQNPIHLIELEFLMYFGNVENLVLLRSTGPS